MRPSVPKLKINAEMVLARIIERYKLKLPPYIIRVDYDEEAEVLRVLFQSPEENVIYEPLGDSFNISIGRKNQQIIGIEIINPKKFL